MSIIMQCGCRASGYNAQGVACCGVHFGIHPGAAIPMEPQPDLTGRRARCSECPKIVPSRRDLPFFEYCPKAEMDVYYCGCHGWD